MSTPYLEVTGDPSAVRLRPGVMTVGSGIGVDVRLTDPTVSRLHAELVRRGPYVYVDVLAPPRYRTHVNGHLIRGRALLYSGDTVSFGQARCRAGGLPSGDVDDTCGLAQGSFPEITRREEDVLTALCHLLRSGKSLDGFDGVYHLATRLGVSCGDVKNHLVRLCDKFHVQPGPRRRTRLANDVIARGIMTKTHVPGDRRAR